MTSKKGADQSERSSQSSWPALYGRQHASVLNDAMDHNANLIFIPLGNATPDYCGAGRRCFDDDQSSSLGAVDVARRLVPQSPLAA